jgi:hypothetical protein
MQLTVSPRFRRRIAMSTGSGLLVVGSALPGAAATGQPTARPPADQFSTRIDNPLLPNVPGTRMIYRSTDAGRVGREVVRVTHQTVVVDGVRVRVVRDRASVGGKLVEDTRDFLAQDSRGNVWYFGEDTKTLKNGKVTSTAGSWQAGRDGARPGIVMEAHPKVGDRYAQEVAPGVAQDRAKVLNLDASASVAAGMFTGLLKTKDFSPLEPSVVEHKFYLRGVGSVLEEEVRGGTERLELVRVVRP